MSRLGEFRLARLLRVKESLADLARSEWGTAEASARDARLAAEAAARELSEARAERESLLRGGRIWPLGELALERIEKIGALDVARRRERARTLGYQAEQAREHWLACDRERAGLAELGARAGRARRTERARRESAAMDEVASRRARSVDYS